MTEIKCNLFSKKKKYRLRILKKFISLWLKIDVRNWKYYWKNAIKFIIVFLR